MGGVSGQVHDDLMNLSGTRQDGRSAGFDLDADLDSGGKGSPQEFEGLVDHRLELDGLAGLFLLSAESENLQDQFLGALTCFKHFPQTFTERFWVGSLKSRQLRVTGDAAQDVVEIVRDTAC